MDSQLESNKLTCRDAVLRSRISHDGGLAPQLSSSTKELYKASDRRPTVRRRRLSTTWLLVLTVSPSCSGTATEALPKLESGALPRTRRERVLRAAIMALNPLCEATIHRRPSGCAVALDNHRQAESRCSASID